MGLLTISYMPTIGQFSCSTFEGCCTPSMISDHLNLLIDRCCQITQLSQSRLAQDVLKKCEEAEEDEEWIVSRNNLIEIGHSNIFCCLRFGGILRWLDRSFLLVRSMTVFVLLRPVVVINYCPFALLVFVLNWLRLSFRLCSFQLLRFEWRWLLLLDVNGDVAGYFREVLISVGIGKI